MRNVNDIVGARIIGIKLNGLKDYMRVITDKGLFNFVAVGDCCSNSWIEHLNGVKNVIEGVVTEVPELDPPCNKQLEADRYEVIQQYITKIQTDKGTLDIEFRNCSNGCYSGWLNLDTGQYSRPVEELDDLKDVTQDF